MPLLQIQKRRMALAGVVLTIYVLFHMLSNLSFFAQGAFNRFYSVYNQPWIRWPVLLLVLAALMLHIKVAVTLRLKNRRARRHGYKKYDYLHIPATLVSLSISLIFVFIILHVVQALLIDTTDIKQVMTAWFSSLWLTLFYLLSIFILALHLQHSLVNVLQTLGITSVMYRGLVLMLVTLVTLGFVSIPLSVWLRV